MKLPLSPPIRHNRLKLPTGTLFWHEAGQGETLLCLHGTWQDGSQWLPLVQQLMPDFHCLVPDLLGFGESWGEATTYSVALQVEALHSLLTMLRETRCHIVAHSLGAWVAVSYALQYPDQVSSLTLIDPEGMALSSMPRRWRLDRWLVAGISPLPLLLAALAPGAPWLGYQPWLERLRRRRQRLLHAPAACQMLFQRRRAALAAEWLPNSMPEVAMPTRVITTSAADPVTTTLAQEFLSALPQASERPLPQEAPPLMVEATALATIIRETTGQCLSIR
jgi:pimeloyl-ACP methyl ester carboxylesterase